MLNPSTFLKGVIDNIGSLINLINPFSEDFALKKLFNWLNPFSDDFILKNIITGIGDILSYINPFSDNFFGKKIIELLKDALQWLFIPSEERITAITNTVSSKFDFVDTIKYSIESLQNIINNVGNAPKLEISIGSTKYTSEQTVKVIDFSWYAPFKTYGDLIITGFVYIFFLWRIFINLPNIIHGLGGVVDSNQMIGDIDAYNNTGFGRSNFINFRRGGGRR